MPAAGPLLAADSTVPPTVQAALTLRILEYDRALKTWAAGGLSVGVVARQTGGDAAAVRDALAGHDAQGVPLKAADHAYQGADALGKWMERGGIRLLYLSPDLAADTAAIVSAASARKIATLSATRGQFDAGTTLAIVVREGRPHILVNLPAAKAAGLDLDPKLLQVSEVVR